MPDWINGFFEFVGGLLTFLNCLQLMKDKQIKGVRWDVNIFFASWSLWNLYYYPHLNQWASFIGGLLIGMGNIWWCVLAVYYTRKKL